MAICLSDTEHEHMSGSMVVMETRQKFLSHSVSRVLSSVTCGEVAQLVERVVRNDEVGSSILLFSTTIPRSYLPSVGRFYL